MKTTLPKTELIRRILSASFPMPDMAAHKNYLWSLSPEALAERMAILETQGDRCERVTAQEREAA